MTARGAALAGVSVVRGGDVCSTGRLDRPRGRAVGRARPERRRQDDAAADPRRPDPPDRRRRRTARRTARPRSTSSSCGPRIGLASAALADRLPARASRSRDVVVTAAYAVLGRWREEYDELDHAARPSACWPSSASRTCRPHLRHAVRGRAQAGPDRPRADDRPRAAAAGRAGRRPRPRRPRGPGPRRSARSPTRSSPAMVLVTHHVEEIPPGFTHALLLSRAASSRPARLDRGPDRRDPEHTFDLAALPEAGGRPLHSPRPLTRDPAPGLTRPNGGTAWRPQRG